MFLMSAPISARSTIRRYAHRAAYERETIDAILDAGFVCHVGFVAGENFPVVIPLAYGRSGDHLYFHGSAASRTFRGARGSGVTICVTVTLVDGIVVARSTYNTDINYRSVVLFGDAVEIDDLDEKRHGLELLVDHILPGRVADAREPTEKELRATMLLRMPINEASAKVRTGWPNDEEEDYALPVWAGVIPIQTVPGPPETDPRYHGAESAPAYLVDYARPRGALA